MDVLPDNWPRHMKTFDVPAISLYVALVGVDGLALLMAVIGVCHGLQT